MATSSTVSPEQLATFRGELIQLLKANNSTVELGNIQALYSKIFQKNISLKQYGISSLKQIGTLFGDVMGIINKGKRQFLRLLKQPSTKMDKPVEILPSWSSTIDDSRALKGQEVKRQAMRPKIAVYEKSERLTSTTDPPHPANVETYMYTRSDDVASNFPLSAPVPQTYVQPPQVDLKKNLIGLLQNSPEGIGLHCLPQVYCQKYFRPMNLTDYGIDSVGSLAVIFRDIFEVVSRCGELKYQFIRNKQFTDADAVKRPKTTPKNELLRREIEELLRRHPLGISLTNLSRIYSQIFRKNVIKTSVIIDKFKNDFDFFTAEDHQFLQLKPGLSLTETVGPRQGLVQPSSEGYAYQMHQVDQVSNRAADVHISGTIKPELVGAYPMPLMGRTPNSSSGQLQGNPHRMKTNQQYEHSGRTISWFGDPRLEQRPEEAAAAAAPGVGSIIGTSNRIESRGSSVVSHETVQASEVFKLLQDKLKNKSVATKQKEEQSNRKQQMEKQQKQKQQLLMHSSTKQQDLQQPAVSKHKQNQPQQQQQQYGRQQTAAQRQVSAKKQDPNQSREDAVAQNIITNLAEANELVTVDRVVELLKQHFQVTRLNELKLHRETDIPSVNQLKRLQAKVTAFIQAFVKVRAISTLHELRESLAMVDAPIGSTDKLDYASLELGPLTKQPLVWDFFKFPPTKVDSDIPKITTLDILEVLNKFLTARDLWRSRVKLEEFMEFLIEEYKVEGPFDLGVRINSVGLGIAALKTAKREQKTIMDHARGGLKARMTDDVKEAMEKIRKSVMTPADLAGHQFTPGPQLELRRRYVNMTAVDAINTVFNNLCDLVEYDRDLRQFCLSLNRVVVNPLSRSLFQLALCSGDLSRPDDLPEGFLDSEDEEEEDDSGPDKEKSPMKTQPTEDQVKQELVHYFNRLQHGMPNLKDLARIETKLCQHFGYQNFQYLSRAKRTFLEFLSIDQPGVLDGVGGTVMGLVSSNRSQGSVYRPSRMDLVEFICQCDPHKESQDTVDSCLCAHYQVSTVEELGHGPGSRLSQPIIKKAATLRQQQDRNAVIYETALCAANRRNESKRKEVGLFGSQRVEDALLCLQSAPLLEDLAEWSHWPIVFEPEHGDLKAFLERNPGQGLSPPIEINALEVRPGVLLRLATETSNDLFAASAQSGDSISTVGHLVSLVVRDGLSNVPMALLGNHMETALNMMGVASDHSAVIGFVLECLVAVPLLIAQAVLRQVILNPLMNVLGSEVKSRQLILKSCKSNSQKSRIQRLGLLLGISQWKDSFQEERMPRNVDNEQDLSGDEEDFDVSDFLSVKMSRQAIDVPPKLKESISSIVADAADEAGDDSYRPESGEDETVEDIKEDGEDEIEKREKMEDAGEDIKEDGEDGIVKREKMEDAGEDIKEDGEDGIVKREKMEDAGEDIKEDGEDGIVKREKMEDAEEDIKEDGEDGIVKQEKMVDVGEDIRKNGEDDIVNQDKGEETGQEDIEDEVQDVEKDAVEVDIDEEEERDLPGEQLEGEMSESSSTTSDEKLSSEIDECESSSDDEISDDEETEPLIDLTPYQQSVLNCKTVIDSIRKDEFGIGMELNEETQRLMNRHQERIGRSLKRLSEELYSKDTHFVLELIQNADDNDYADGVEPSLVFVVDKREVVAMNNERGFSESNIRALCDVGRSTKGKHKIGYIGHKGIGFKSVFRVTDKPEIISMGYHICFDHSSDPMGYILPTWVGPGDIEEIAQIDEPSEIWTTQIQLPLKGDVQRTTSLVNKFEDVQPSLLLFLNRLRSVTIVNTDDNTKSRMSRKDIGDNVVEIRHSKRTDRWLLIKKCLDATKLQRTQIESTELGLAFPLSEAMSTEQNVFAFLPLRSYGFHFIIQGDFDIPSSREDVDADSAWNQWLLQEIAPLFTQALDSFKTHYHGDPIKAVCQFLKFVPLEDQILTDFFKKVASNIHYRLKATPCMPVLTEDGEDEVAWRLPSETIMFTDRVVFEVVSSNALKAHLNCSYLHPRVMDSVSEVLLKSLGVKVLQTAELLDMLNSIVSSAKQKGEVLQPKYIAQWLTCIYLTRKREYDISEETLKRLRSLPMIPLSSGQVVAMEEGSVFFPISEEETDQSQGQIQSGSSKPLQALEKDMSTLESSLLNSLDKVSNSQIVQMLEELGVRHISPREVIHHHILPVIKSDQWKEKSRDVMIGYVVFIKENLEKQASVCDIDEIGEWLHVMTSHGLVKPRERPVHFTVTYGNKTDLNHDLPGCDWVLLDSCYILHHGAYRPTTNDIRQWHSFFSNLGVLNYLAVEKKVITVKEEELDVTPWADIGKFWAKPPGGVYMIHDNVCQELEELFRADLEVSQKQTQRLNLLRLLQQEWSSNYAGYTNAAVFDQSDTKLTDTQSSFSIHLKTWSWLPSTPISWENAAVVFRSPGEIFIAHDRVRTLLSNHVPYMLNEVPRDMRMLQFIGVKTAGVINENFMMSMLKKWSSHDEPSSDLTKRTLFSTSLGHITRVYEYLKQYCRPQEIRDLFDDHRVVFTSETRSHQNVEAPVQGLFVHKNMVYWKDPSKLLQKYKVMADRIQLGAFYSYLPDIDQFFCGLINVDTVPTIKEYAELLVQCASDIKLPDNSRIKEEILVLYDVLGHKCLSTSSSDKYNQQRDMYAPNTAKQQLEVEPASAQFIRRLLEDQPVFPTSGNKWVTLAERPLICDGPSTDLQKLFADQKGVHLINFGDRDRLGRVIDGVYKAGSTDRPNYVQVFFQACGVEKLADCVKEEFITELTKPSVPLQLFLHEICPYVQLYMSQHSTKDIHSAYEKLISEVKIAAKLKVMRFMEAKRLEKIYRYQHDPSVFAKQNVSCGLQELTEFYITTAISQHLQNNSDIRREVAKLFSCGSAEVQSALFNFLGNLRLELGNRQHKADKGVNERICKALNLHFPLEDGAEPWEVPKPIIPEDPPKIVVKPVQAKSVPDPQPATTTPLDCDDDAAIYSWPPKSGAYGPTGKLAKGAHSQREDSILKMWPPPQPPVDTLPSLYSPGPHRPTDGQQRPADSLPQEDTRGSTIMVQHQGSQEGMVVRSSGSWEKGQVNPAPGVRQGLARDGNFGTQRHLTSEGTPLPNRPLQGQCQELGQFISPVIRNADTLESEENVEERSSTADTSVKESEEERDSVDEIDDDDDVDDDDEDDEEGDGGDDVTQGPPQPPGTVNRQFHTPPQIQRSGPSSGSARRFFLSPLTDGEAATVEFEDVAHGPALLESLTDANLHLGDNQDMGDVGRWGENLVFLYLVQKAHEDPEIAVNWVNKHAESGEPYDIVITHGTTNIYIEVKSTILDKKQLFEISSKEVAFAQEQQKFFHLYRVFNVGNTSAMRVCRICDLGDRMNKKEVKLFMYI